MMKPEDEKKVVVGCTVIVTSSQTKCSVAKRQGLRVRVAYSDGKESWLEIKDLELCGYNTEDVGGGEKKGEAEPETSEAVPPKPPARELEGGEPDAGRARTGSQVVMGEGGEVKVMKLMPTTKEDMTELTGMNNLKNKINGIAAEVLWEGVMEQEEFASFKDASEQESDAKDLTELYAEAGAVLHVFAETMLGIVVGLGMDAEKYPEVEGERIVDDGFEFKALTCAPLKGRKRAEEKIKDDYEGNFKCMLDLVRCSIIVETEEQLGGVLGKILELGIVVRLKNRFANPLPTGIRDCLMNVKINNHICEVQLHLSYIIKEKGAMHEYYNFFRDKFSGASATYTEVMGKVEALGLDGGEENVEYGVSKLLKEGDVGKLNGLADIVGRKEGFGDVKLDLVLRRRVVEVLEGGGGKGGSGNLCKLELMDAYLELGDACNWAYEDDDSEKYFKLAKEGYEEVLGAESEKALEVTYKLILTNPNITDKGERIEKLNDVVKRMEGALGDENVVTLTTLNELGEKLRQNGQYEETKEVHERCLAGRMKVLGGGNKHTLMTLGNLGNVYKNLENYERASEYYERALKGYERLLGKNHPQTLSTVMNIANVFWNMDDFGKAEEMYQKALEGYEAQLGKEHIDTMRCAENYRDCLEESGNKEGMADLKKGHPNVESYDT
ncbi:hypothetical protein TL16_g04913 [Triparma laevis f. inornata]|uniref:Kinesin light chain n=1 Tax=Triparma laevis f. inornata TaxID=1714386 RepID=A0A9W7E7I3_9STRA|nr:hypothetical protein TL16_g04913 [Triparma laevis f. inornata]